MTIDLSINPLYPDEYDVLTKQLQDVDGCSVRRSDSIHYDGSGAASDIAVIAISSAVAITAVCKAIATYFSRSRCVWINKDGQGGGVIVSAADFESLKPILEAQKDTNPKLSRKRRQKLPAQSPVAAKKKVPRKRT